MDDKTTFTYSGHGRIDGVPQDVLDRPLVQSERRLSPTEVAKAVAEQLAPWMPPAFQVLIDAEESRVDLAGVGRRQALIGTFEVRENDGPMTVEGSRFGHSRAVGQLGVYL